MLVAVTGLQQSLMRAHYKEEKESFPLKLFLGAPKRAVWLSVRGITPTEISSSFYNSLKTAIVVVTLLFNVELELKFSLHYICWESFLCEEILQGLFLKMEKHLVRACF